MASNYIIYTNGYAYQIQSDGKGHKVDFNNRGVMIFLTDAEDYELAKATVATYPIFDYEEIYKKLNVASKIESAEYVTADELDEAIDGVEETTDGLDERLTAAEGDIEDLDTRVTALENPEESNSTGE